MLLQLDDVDLRSQFAMIENQLFELMARRGQLDVERDDARDMAFDSKLLQVAAWQSDVAELKEGQRNLFLARRVSVTQAFDQLSKRSGRNVSQLAGINAQMASLTTLLSLIYEELASHRSLLEKGLVPA